MGSTTALLDFDAVFVINLPHREDRRQEVEEQLQTCGMSLNSPNVHLFPAIRPDTADPFPSIGAKGCFLSHLGVLRLAHEAGHDNILLLEDDVDFTKTFRNPTPQTVETLKTDRWDISYFGHRIEGFEASVAADQLQEFSPNSPIGCSHSIALRGTVIKEILEYFELLLSRPPGHPEGGPMHVDGAYSWFRKTHPQRVTLVAASEWAVQRLSRTDIADNTWKEKLPFIGVLRRLKNRLRS